MTVNDACDTTTPGESVDGRCVGVLDGLTVDANGVEDIDNGEEEGDTDNC